MATFRTRSSTVRGGDAIRGSGSLLVAGPTNLTLPVVSGTLQVGQTVSTTNGTWTPAPTSYAYQWLRNGTPIGSATSSSYLLGGADLGTVITVTVTATNAGGSTAATSASAVQPGLPWIVPQIPGGPALFNPPVVTAPAGGPVNTVLPAISGTPVVGNTLTGSTGTWTGAGITYTFQWYLGGAAIIGATGATFSPTSAQTGTVTVAVTATNSGGTATAVSPSVMVTAAATGNPTTFIDRFSPRAKPILYRVLPVFVDTFGAEFAGNYTNPATTTLASDNQDWFMSLGNSALDAAAIVEGVDRAGTSNQDQAVYYPEGRLDAVVNSGTIHLESFGAGAATGTNSSGGVTVWFKTDAAWANWKALRARSEPVLWRRTYGDTGGAEQDWVRFGGAVVITRRGSYLNQPGQLRSVSLSLIVVATPPS